MNIHPIEAPVPGAFAGVTIRLEPIEAAVLAGALEASGMSPSPTVRRFVNGLAQVVDDALAREDLIAREEDLDLLVSPGGSS